MGRKRKPYKPKKGRKLTAAGKNARELARVISDKHNNSIHVPPPAHAIQALRFHLGLSCKTFARQIGATEFAVRQWEIGRRGPRAEFTERIEALAALNNIKLTEVDKRRAKPQVHVFVDREVVPPKRRAI